LKMDDLAREVTTLHWMKRHLILNKWKETCNRIIDKKNRQAEELKLKLQELKQKGKVS